MSRSVQRRSIALSRPSLAKGLSTIRFDYWDISIRFCPHRGAFLYANENATIAAFAGKQQTAPFSVPIGFNIQQRKRAEYIRRIGRRCRMQTGLVEPGKAGDAE